MRVCVYADLRPCTNAFYSCCRGLVCDYGIFSFSSSWEIIAINFNITQLTQGKRPLITEKNVDWGVMLIPLRLFYAVFADPTEIAEV